MVAVEKLLNKRCTVGKLTGMVFDPTKTFFPDGPVEALNVGLFVLLVGSSYPMSITKLMDMRFKYQTFFQDQ